MTRNKELPRARSLPFVEETIRLRKQWEDLSSRYLTISTGDEIWRYSRGWLPSDADQGWKIHLSATILSACDVFAAAAPFLKGRGILFKAAASLEELAKINSGLWYGYSQIGKFITVYPIDEKQFTQILSELARLMPVNVDAPKVPFDIQYLAAPNLFYRYGSFVTRSITDEHGRDVPALRNASGDLTPDNRGIAHPDWVLLPTALENKPPCRAEDSPLTTRYRVFRSISQRGKGGVYEAIDTQSDPPRLCIVKEGRKHGEVAWDGRDGHDRVRNEQRVLRSLAGKVAGLAPIYDLFEADGNLYVVLEKVDGENLEKLVGSELSELSFEKRLDIARQIACVVAQLHANGIVWRDCKPSNFLLSPEGIIRPIDFEGATAVDSPQVLPWNTPNFAPPELDDPRFVANIDSNLPEDLFALGTCIRRLFEPSFFTQNVRESHSDECEKQSPICGSDFHEGKSRSNTGNDGSLEGKSHARGRKIHSNNRKNHLNNGENGFRQDESDSPCGAGLENRRRDHALELLNTVVYQLTGENPSSRPSAGDTLKILDLIQRHLTEEIRKPDVISDGIE